MPTWSNQLPAQGKHHGFDLRRTPATSAICAVCTCDDLLVCDTHFWHGRTTPCERTVNEEGRTVDDSLCSACRDKQAWRTHVYVSAFDVRSHEHFVFECTANAAKAFAEYRAAANTLRGCSFHASRPKQGPNSKVVIATNTVNLTKVNLPAPPDLPRALAIIWRLPQTALPVVEPAYEPPTIRANGHKLKSMREQPADAGLPPTIGDILAPHPR